MKILSFGEEFEQLSGFAEYFEKEHHIVLYTEKEEEAHEQLQSQAVGAVVVSGQELLTIKGLITSHPIVNYTLVSSKPSKEFHESTEELGGLMQILCLPGIDDAGGMITRLQSLALCAVAEQEAEAS